MPKELSKLEAKKRIEKLKELINYHRYLYHVLDRQEISDAAFDSLKKELFDLEQKFPEFITPDSPTQRVGGKPLEKFEKVRHPRPMLSLNDAFSEKDMDDWFERIGRLLTQAEITRIDFYSELKIDGLAIELIYKDEIFKTGSTRGDGIIGEDVTQNLKTIEAIPLKLRDEAEVIRDLEKEGLKEIARAIRDKGLKEAVVRGEVFISKKEFEKVNKEQEKAGLSLFANPRNVAAGSIRQLDPKITAKRHLDSYAYDLISDLGQITHQEKHKILKILGFKTNPNNEYCNNLKEVFEFHSYWQKNREKLYFEIDGIVVIVNDNRIFEKLGVVGKSPRGAIAYKFPLKQSTTIIDDIKVQVGRTGSITPVAVLKPVEVGGVTISRATLHNVDEIKRLGVKIGDTVVVGRAGDVIPDIIKVLPELRTGKEKEFKMPKKCPVCGSKLVRKSGEVNFYCPNKNCLALRKRFLYHFVSKGAFNIVHVGPKIIDRLLDEGLIEDAVDIFKLEKGDLASLERFGEKSAQNIIDSIEKAKEILLSRFIYALGIRHVGEETAIELANHFGSIEKIEKASFEEINKIKDIGDIVAKSIYEWFKNKENLKLVDGLIGAGIKIIKPEKIEAKLKGLTFVFTGTLNTMARDEAEDKVRLLGGDVSSSVSQETDYVVAGETPGLKYERAKKLGVKVINEKEFLAMLK